MIVQLHAPRTCFTPTISCAQGRRWIDGSPALHQVIPTLLPTVPSLYAKFTKYESATRAAPYFRGVDFPPGTKGCPRISRPGNPDYVKFPLRESSHCPSGDCGGHLPGLKYQHMQYQKPRWSRKWSGRYNDYPKYSPNPWRNNNF